MTRPLRCLVISTLWLSFLTAHLAIASNGTLYLYSGSDCSDPNPIKILADDDGLCTTITHSFWSLKLATLDDGCTSTVYSRANQYCGNDTQLGLYDIFLNQCVGNDTSINQFTVDCPSFVVSPSPSPSPSPPSPTSSSSSGISPSIELGLGIGLSVGSLIVIAIAGFIWWSLRKKTREVQRENDPATPAAHTTTPEKGRAQLLEADGREAFPNTAYEMGYEKRPSRICELDGGWEGSEMHASSATPTLVQDRIGSDRTEPSVV